jgi:hypothetical protein
MDLARGGRTFSFGRWSVGLAVTAFALLFATTFVIASVLAGHPTIIPPLKASRPVGYERMGLLVVGIIVLVCSVGALILGVLGIRREKSASSWIGASGGFFFVSLTAAALVGQILVRAGVPPKYVETLQIAAPNLILVLVLLAVVRLVWRAVRQGPPRG